MAPKKTFPFEKNIEYAFFTCPPDRVIRFHLSLVHYALCFFLTLNFSFFTFYCFSQGAAINTTGVASDPSAMLDVSSTNQGMRIPRVALTSTTSSAPITNPANSLLVYDSVTTGDVTPGFYYWDNNKWIRLATGNSIPTPGPISGITSLCSGASQNYNISAVTGANTYTWTVPSGAVINSGQGTTSINVTFGNTSGTVCVDASDYNASSSSRCINVSVNLPVTPGSIIGPVSVYPNQTSVSYSISAVSGATSYTWNLPAGATIASGANTKDIEVNFACGAISGNIEVIANTSCGTSSASLLAITVSTLQANTLPLVGGNTALGGAPTATGGTSPYSYLWTPSTGLSNPTVPNPTAPCAGVTTTYTVIVTDAKSCTATNSVTVSRLTASAGSSQTGLCGITLGGNPTTAIGGIAPFTYLWSSNPTTTNVNGSMNPNPAAAPLPLPNYITTYTVTVTDINGCTATSATTLTLGSGTTVTFSTPGSSSWLVPTGKTCVLIEAWGAEGGKAYFNYASLSNPGKGGYVYGTKTELIGGSSVLNIYIGGKGGDGASGSAGVAGSNGGAAGGSYSGAGGGGGGGASDVRFGGIALTNRIIVGGGGGGGGYSGSSTGGNGGYTNGTNGKLDGSYSSTTCGAGGSQTAGGAGANGASPGDFGTGGAGVISGPNGGGGAGYYGGGGANCSGYGAGGGGGSSYIGGMASGGYNNGTQSGNGQVKITY